MKIVILGTGRIAEALHFFYARGGIFPRGVTLLTGEDNIPEADLIVGALPGGLGEQSLQAALDHKKDLIDLADLDGGWYLKRKREIASKGILVIPACGFCPGLVNFIIGNESIRSCRVESVEVMAGTLSTKKNFFPFLWCFEDMVLEFLGPSVQVIEGKRKKVPPFAGYREESMFRIPSESYLSPSGFENLADRLHATRFIYRNIRPRGFRYFFLYLLNHGFFEETNLPFTKTMLEHRKEDNLSVAEISLSSDSGTKTWRIKSFSGKDEPLSSMQKIAALFTVAMIRLIAQDKIRERGVLFCEDIGRNKKLFKETIGFLRSEGISIRCSNG